jgi:hypothetical protein
LDTNLEIEKGDIVCKITDCNSQSRWRRVILHPKEGEGLGELQEYFIQTFREILGPHILQRPTHRELWILLNQQCQSTRFAEFVSASKWPEKFSKLAAKTLASKKELGLIISFTNTDFDKNKKCKRGDGDGDDDCRDGTGVLAYKFKSKESLCSVKEPLHHEQIALQQGRTAFVPLIPNTEEDLYLHRELEVVYRIKHEDILNCWALKNLPSKYVLESEVEKLDVLNLKKYQPELEAFEQHSRTVYEKFWDKQQIEKVKQLEILKAQRQTEIELGLRGINCSFKKLHHR